MPPRAFVSPSGAPSDSRAQAERSRARALAYDLFARLFREGPTPELGRELADLPVLAPALSPASDFDTLLAQHHDLFALQVFPYGGAFLEVDGRAGGPSAEPVREVAGLLGQVVEVGGEAVDHLSRELELLSHLSLAEARGEVGAEGPARHLLTRHLLWWLPPFLVAVARERAAFWTLVADLTFELALDHLRGLHGILDPGSSLLPEPSVPDLSRSDTELREVRAYLITPSRSGLHLSVRALRDLGRALALPAGFGSRERVLAGLFEAGAEYGAVAGLVDGLSREVEDCRSRLSRLTEGAPELDASTGAWFRRMEATSHLLGRVRAETDGQ